MEQGVRASSNGILNREVDPFTFQIIRHRLNMVVEEAAAALKNVSGSPITNEGHDMMVALYSHEGRLVAGGAGFLYHITSAAEAVKHILRYFGKGPGISDGDVYLLNDAYTAALHAPDVYIVSPVFWEGELTAFVANFVHITDVGAIDPGGFAPNARSSYEEGFQTRGLKIVDEGRVRQDVIDTILNMVRDPEMVELDLRSQLAANHVAKERLYNLYSDFGQDTVANVSDGLIDEASRLIRARLKSLPSGIWRSRAYVDAGDHLARVELEVRKDGDQLHYDFTGSSEQLPISVNASYWGAWGGVCASVFPLLAWDLPWNEGVVAPITMTAPIGSVVNCERPSPVSVATVGMVEVISNLSVMSLSRIMGASEEWAHRSTAIWHGSHAAVRIFGEDSGGRSFVAALTDAFCGAGGATSKADGVDLGGEIPNVVSRWANVETHELNTPILYLYRRALADSGGAGRYRGGMGHEFAFKPHATASGSVGVTVFGKGVGIPQSYSIAGGSPGSTLTYQTLRSGDAAAGHPLSEEISWGSIELGPEDVQHIECMGGGGYGDPLHRPVEEVVSDVASGSVTPVSAHDDYGVVIDDAGAAADEATRSLRMLMRSERVGHEITREVREVPLSGKPLSTCLQMTDDGETQCTSCGELIAPRGGQWKDHAITRFTLLENSPRQRALGLRAYYCSGCATSLEVEVAGKDDGHLYDEITAWPGQGSR